MCGRFTLRTPTSLLIKQFALPFSPEWTPRFNIAPTQEAAVVRLNSHGQRELALLHWGLIPSWSKEFKMGGPLINARAETVDTKPSFRAAFKKRRCLVLADGYYEWRKEGKLKQPYHVHLRDEKTFAFAGFWERWRGTGNTANSLDSCTIVTTASNKLTRDIHERMPVILSSKDHSLWLDSTIQSRQKLNFLFEPFPSELMVMDAVSTRINSVKNDDAACLDHQQELF